jgi:hypothetical protein
VLIYVEVDVDGLLLVNVKYMRHILGVGKLNVDVEVLDLGNELVLVDVVV